MDSTHRFSLCSPLRWLVAAAGAIALLPVCRAGWSDTVRYVGSVVSNPYQHDGGLAPVVGTHCRQVVRADRGLRDARHCMGWTYLHQPMLARWQGRFWLHFLADPVSEHEPPSVTWVTSSADGTVWEEPRVLFPEYEIPDGFTKTGDTVAARSVQAVMHQRVGFYVSSEATGNRLLALGNYGVCLHPGDDPNDGNGIGRVVREIRADGSLGPIYFLYLNHDFSFTPRRDGKWPVLYPSYTEIRDKQLRAACQEVIDAPLYWMQWVEEADRHDPHLPLDAVYKAFCYYRLPDDTTLVGLWKHALTSVSVDEGRTWRSPAVRAPGFVNSNAKIWGQRLADGSYATVYNPAEFRWPLALSTSADGLTYTTLNVIHGEIPPMRYGGTYKSYGPQYPRGILPGNGTTRDLWVTYSVNKEDIWIARVPVPIRARATAHADDDFASATQLELWNLYMPAEAPVYVDSGRLVLRDADRFDYAKAERIIPPSRQLTVSFDVTVEQIGRDGGTLEVELLDDHGTPCTRLAWRGDSLVEIKVGARWNTLSQQVTTDRPMHVELAADLDHRTVTVAIDGKRKTKMLFSPLAAISRVCFRTGERRLSPTPETPADRRDDLPDADGTIAPAIWSIDNFRTAPATLAAEQTTKEIPAEAACAVLSADDMRRYVTKFNNMEDENIVQAIPNARAERWMEGNIPLFDCPDGRIEEIYYYRWWSLRKHIVETPTGHAMTEFLVPRSYADTFNLISCAVGHHLMETRWLRDASYYRQIATTWLRGHEGGPMRRLDWFSSWLPAAVVACAEVRDDWAWATDLLPDLADLVTRWDTTHRSPDGLYWQYDVRDGMEESISGARRARHRRPSINSYMYGNLRALAQLAARADSSTASADYAARADTLRTLVEERIWDAQLSFFCTRTEADTSAAVREAIGFLPWYFHLPSDDAKYHRAWQQAIDGQGFAAPFGLTTAERRHPAFRSHGTGRCEWDGAIWPFATAQTLTAWANYLNDYTVSDDSAMVAAYYHQFALYAAAQYRRGLPYIGEYLDETDGHWLMGDRERSRYYNHSTYADLLISGLVGLRPAATGDGVIVRPLLPQGQWDYFCLDGVSFRGHLITVLWDADGTRYRQGQGLRLFVDGHLVASRPDLGRLAFRD